MSEVREPLVRKFVEHLKEIERWSARNKDSVLGALFIESENPMIAEIFEHTRDRPSFRYYVEKFIRSHLPDNVTLTFAPLPTQSTAATIIEEGQQPHVIVSSVNTFSGILRKTVLPHEAAHIEQHRKEDPERLFDPNTRGYFLIYLPSVREPVYIPSWNDLEVSAEREALKKLLNAHEKIRNPILFLRHSLGLSDYEGLEDLFRKYSSWKRLIDFERDASRFLENVLLEQGPDKFEELVNKLHGIGYFYNYYFAPVVHFERERVPAGEHTQSILQALKFIGRYAEYFRRLRRLKEELARKAESSKMGEFPMIAREFAQQLFGSLPGHLPILPVLNITTGKAVEVAINALPELRDTRGKKEQTEELKRFVNDVGWQVYKAGLEEIERRNT